ncbi:MAG TPA: FAD-binding oxidoreductase [Kiloniellaceae bacterium]|nr:FAD-binding oxidoreductase [Kiloniellaceae bacterium]
MIRDLLDANLDGQVIDQDHSEYEKRRRVWNATADRRPAVIVRASSVADIQRTVQVAAEHGALLAVRGGGHSIPGLSTCDDGIVLDLSLMNAVTVDNAAQRAMVMGGALLGDLDKAGASAGLVVPAGVVSHTGAAGLTLGGGMGWLSRRFGLTIDCLLAANIVTADGKAREISADAEPDLFWAIRGGGGNFGVVTSFTFKMHPLGPVLVGRWLYPLAEAATVLRGLRELAASASRELTVGFVLTTDGLRITVCWSGSPDLAESAIAPFGTLGRPESVAIGGVTFLELQQLSDERMAWDRRYYAKGGFLKEIDDAAIERMVDSIGSAPSADAEFYFMQLGGAVRDVNDDATAYTGRLAGYYWIVESGWDRAEDDVKFLGWSRGAAGRLAEVSMKGNYVNEQGDIDKDIARAAYGEQKYDRLARLKARYDPNNLFRLNQNIEPKP